MRVVFAGTPEAAVPSLDALVASDHDVVAVVTRPDAPRGRSKKLIASPVAERSAELGLETLKPDHPRDAGFLERLRVLGAGCVAVVAYGALVPPSALSIPTQGWINLHFSILPAWRGAAPVQRALMAGVSETGATTFRIDEGLDSGPVYRTLRVAVDEDVSAGELLTQLTESGARLLVDTVDDVQSGVDPVPQPIHGATRAPKVTVDDAHIDWTRAAREAHNLIRGCNPSPGAWTTYAGARLKVLASRLSELCDLAPGQLRADAHTVQVGTGSGNLELVTVQPTGKRPMDASAWGRGLRDEQPWLR